jgi:hypothetical protein
MGFSENRASARVAWSGWSFVSDFRAVAMMPEHGGGLRAVAARPPSHGGGDTQGSRRCVER